MGRFKKFANPVGVSFVWEATDKKKLDEYCIKNKLGQNQVLLEAFQVFMEKIHSNENATNN